MFDLNKENVQKLLSELSPEEYEMTMQILREISETGQSRSLMELYEEDYEEIPVSIDEFIDNPRYAGWYTNNGKDIYPYWRNHLRKIFEGDSSYSEIAITGSIGCGKTHMAVLGLAYCLYRLMCLRNPHEFYRIAKGGNIYIVFFNTTLQLSQSVAYTKFQSLLQNSPWFMERGKVTGTKYLEYIPNGPIRFTTGSQVEHSLGLDVIAGLLDEVNFVKGANIQMEKSKIMHIYNSVLERINSRFIVRGKVQGKLFIVSSKKSEYDFIESYINRQKGKPGIYVVDAKLWEVKPQGTYSGKTFSVALGGKNIPSRIIQEGEDIEQLKRQGYDILEGVPIEFKSRFEMDMEAALMNIAGISITSRSKFFSYQNIEKCYIDDKNPFTNNILTIGLNDSLTIQEFFRSELIPKEVLSMPIFIHIDTSLTGDRTGIGAVAVPGYRYINQYDIREGTVVPTKELQYREVFNVAIECPIGTEISFQKTRNFLYYLKYVLRMNIKGISLDGFQSADTRQQLLIAGFESVDIVSLDRNENGYLTLRAAINEGRINLLRISEREIELLYLERDNITGKVDHPPTLPNGDIGRKDMSDALAGAVYNASLHEQDLDLHLLDAGDIIVDTNESVNDVRNQIFENILSIKKYSITDDMDIIIPEEEPVKENIDLVKEIQVEIKKRKEELMKSNSQNKEDKPDMEEIRKRFLEAKMKQKMSKDVADLTEEVMNQKDMEDGFILF